MSFDATQLSWIAPELVLTAAGCVLMLGGAFLPGSRKLHAWLSIAFLGAAWFTRPDLVQSGHRIFSGALEISAFSLFVDLVIYAGTGLVLLSAAAYFDRDGENRGEIYALLLWTALGLSIMAKANDLIVLFLGLELASMCLYALVGSYRKVTASQEAALKYFITGAFASGLLLYGIALIYSRSGTTALPEAIEALRASGSGDALLGMGFFLAIVGTSFKLGLAPFHAWIPDTYQGAPTPVTAMISVVPKAAAVVVMARIFAAIDATAVAGNWHTLMVIMAVASIAAGNLGALAQQDLKRMLAYSGIAHMGYVAIGFSVFGERALGAVLVYSVAYVFSNVGAFSVSACVTRGEDRPHPIRDLAGLSRTRPILAFAMMIFMVSLAGVPMTAGFVGKFLVFGSAVAGGRVWLVLVGVIGSVISAAYYLRVVHTMYAKDVPDDPPRTDTSWTATFGVVLALIGTLGLGLSWNPISELAMDAAVALLGS